MRWLKLMSNMILADKLVRVFISDSIKDRPPTEDELKEKCEIVRGMIEISDDEVAILIKNLQAALDVAMDTGISLEKEYEPWLKARKEKTDFYYWNRYEKYLEEDMNRPPTVIATMDEISDKIIDLLGDPIIDGPLHRRGLIMGDVQSGKTATYLAVMNKAADVGYQVIILLTGTIESLRRQTQERVDEGFIGRSSKAYLQRSRQTIKKGVGEKDSRRFATGFTTESSDFKINTLRSMNVDLKNMSNEPVVMVLKKNAKTLENLITWLETYNLNNGQVEQPLLLIDDEADNASINTASDNDPTKINKSIRKLLSLFKKSSYVGVTATPFANIFILPEKPEDMDHDDLFPEDYIYSLNPPTNYIGGNELFGDDSQYNSSVIPIADADEVFPYGHNTDLVISNLPASLYAALRYFILANVVRDINGEITTHRSMLINISRLVAVQNQTSAKISEWLYETVRDIKNYTMLPEDVACKNQTLSSLREDWYNESFPFFSKTNISWEEIQHNWLLKVQQIEVRTINEKSSTKILDYTLNDKDGLRVIALGGLSLSRGLTLEGLMVSYFYRNSQMYDTLMQMGRWFGYRTKYEDLCRIWMANEAIGWYAHITDATNELREEISRMNRLGAIPKDFGLKVRAHPTTLIITARNKMKHSKQISWSIDLSGKFFETPRFLSDAALIRKNKHDSDELIKQIFQNCGIPKMNRSNSLIWEDVPAKLVGEFLVKYQNHPLNPEANGPILKKYILQNNLSKWDVLVINNKNPDNNILAFKLDNIEVFPVERPLLKEFGILSSYGTKMRIGTMGLTKNGLKTSLLEMAEKEFRESKRAEYKLKYKEKAEEKLSQMNFPDRAYLIEGRNPILIIHYIQPRFERSSDVPKGFILENDLFVGYGIGFPRTKEGTGQKAVYFINDVEKYVEQEIEEDQSDGGDN